MILQANEVVNFYYIQSQLMQKRLTVAIKGGYNKDYLNQDLDNLNFNITQTNFNALLAQDMIHHTKNGKTTNYAPAAYKKFDNSSYQFINDS